MRRRSPVPPSLLLILVGLSAGSGARALERGDAPPSGESHDATMHHRFEGAEQWAKVFDDPARNRWQKPEKVVRFLRIEPGQSVADIGAGTGYFTVPLAKAVGTGGRVFAVDIEPSMVDYLVKRAAKAGLAQVTPVLGEPADPKLPDGGVDLVFLCDTWHHIDGRDEYLVRLARALRAGGRIAVVDFQEGDLPVGPPAGHKLSREAVIREFASSGWPLAEEYRKLPYQYVLVFTAPVKRP